jgi:cytochrome b
MKRSPHAAKGAMQAALVWDVPTRFFHWTLASSFLGAWLTTGSDRWLAVHVFLGYLMLGLIGFRVIWGLLGTHYARFASFWYGPRTALAYLRRVLNGSAERHVGHNPTGSVAIYFLLFLTLIAGISGILTLGGEEQQGALSGVMNFVQSRSFKKLHEFSANLMLLVVIGHLAGVIVESFVHRENLARSMLTGIKLTEPGAPSVLARSGVAVLMLALILGSGGWWFYYAVDTQIDLARGEKEGPHVKFIGAVLPDDPQWRSECGSCHLPYHPNLLPSRSWKAILAGQAQHFGSDLAIDANTSAALLAYATLNSADSGQTEASYKITRSLKPEAVPLRISETPYWVKKHRNITPAQWQSAAIKSKANCTACHLDADEGTFLDAAMHIPAVSPVSKASQ